MAEKEPNVSVLNFHNAYLQIHSLWPFQTVIYKGLIRMGFALNVAPAIIKTIVDSILAKDEPILQATSAYIDDIYASDDVTSATHIRQHLADFGLMCKVPERLENNTLVLGLQVWW